MNDTVLRRSTAEDAAFIYRVYEVTARPLVEAAGRRWAGALMLEKSQGEAVDPLTRIIQHRGRDCGMYRVEDREAEVWVDLLFLLPDCQRQGIGRALMAGVHEAAAARGVPTRLLVMSFSPARIYYEQFGYVVTTQDGLVLHMERAT